MTCSIRSVEEDRVKLDAVTTVLDTAALVLIAFGLAAAVFPLIGWACAAVAGGVLLAGVRVATWLAAPAKAPQWWRRLQGSKP
jgi:formate hydrogenlyase subunit 3/multisubunit Na+/H+ antiporter MnhD subunit